MMYDIYTSFCLCLIFSRTKQEWQYHISTSRIMVMRKYIVLHFPNKSVLQMYLENWRANSFWSKIFLYRLTCKTIFIAPNVYINICDNRYDFCIWIACKEVCSFFILASIVSKHFAICSWIVSSGRMIFSLAKG